MEATRTLETSRPTQFQKAFMVFGVIMLCVALCCVAAFADGDATAGIKEGIASGMQSAFDLIKAIVIPIAAVVFAANALMMLFGGQRGMEQGKKNMLICLIIIAAVWLAPLIVSSVSSWFENAGDGNAFTITPSPSPSPTN